MASYQYSKCSLQDNWFEDRLDTTEVQKIAKLRPLENSIANVQNDRFEALTRIARVDKKPSYAMPEDKWPFITESAQQIDYKDPESIGKLKPPIQATWITEDTIHEVCDESYRPMVGPRSGHGAVLDRHGENHDRRYWDTTFRTNFTLKGENKVDYTREAGLPCLRVEGGIF